MRFVILEGRILFHDVARAGATSAGAGRGCCCVATSIQGTWNMFFFFGHSDRICLGRIVILEARIFCFTTRPERVPVAGEVVSSTWSSVSGTGAIGASGCCVLPSELCAVLGSEISAAMGI